MYLIHCPTFFLWVVANSWLSCFEECCLNHEVVPCFSTVQCSMFLLFVITTHPLRFNTNILLQLNPHMKIVVCVYVCLPASFSWTSCKIFLKLPRMFWEISALSYAVRNTVVTIFSSPLEVLQVCLTQYFLKASSYISTNLTVAGYYVCEIVTLDSLAKNSLLCLIQIFYWCACTFKQYCAKGKLQSGNSHCQRVWVEVEIFS